MGCVAATQKLEGPYVLHVEKEVVEQPRSSQPQLKYSLSAEQTNAGQENKPVQSPPASSPLAYPGDSVRLGSKGSKGTAVRQPRVLTEQILAVAGSTQVDVSKTSSDLPFKVGLKLSKPSLLTEVEVVWNQSRKCSRRLEILLNGDPTPVRSSFFYDRGFNEEGLHRCRLQLDEPSEAVFLFMVEVSTASNAPAAGQTENILLRDVVPRGLPAGSPPPKRRVIRPPPYWETSEGAGAKRIDIRSEEQVAIFQRLLDETWKDKATRDRKGTLPKRLMVRKVQRVEACSLWNRFSRYRRNMALARDGGRCLPIEELRQGSDHVPVRTQEICDSAPDLFGPLQREVNEHYLFHGTSPSGALGIIKEGFDMRKNRTQDELLFGSGAYFAEAASKFDEYAQADEFSGMCAVLVCRVLCGEMYVALSKLDPRIYGDPEFVDKYDGVLGDREASVGTYREFVVFKQEQAYPEYLVFYDREET